MIKYFCNKCSKEEEEEKPTREEILEEDDVLCEKCWREFLKEEIKLREKFKLNSSIFKRKLVI